MSLAQLLHSTSKKFFLRELKQIIENASTMEDLYPIFKSVGLLKCKIMLKNKLNSYGKHTLKSTCIKSISISKILGTDILTNVLKYSTCYEIGCVSKEFNKISKQIKNNLFLKKAKSSHVSQISINLTNFEKFSQIYTITYIRIR